MAAISVIIVNYGAADLALDAAQSVLDRSHDGHEVDIHLIDNASPGEDAAMIETAMARPAWSERIIFYREMVNHGFGRGNNLAIETLAGRETPPDYVFLLNPDARLKNETIAILAVHLDAHPEAAVAGARIERPNGAGGEEAVTAAFRFPSLASTFAAALAFGPVSRLFRSSEVPLAPETPTGRVDWVAGAAVMFRFDALRAAGGFDPDYFLYYEEVDLMRRLGQQGGETWHVAEAEAIHVEGVSTGVKSGEAARRRRPSYWYASWRMYFLKNHGRAYAAAAGTAWIAGAALNHVIARLRGKAPAAPLNFFGDFWAMAARPILGLEARPYD